MLLLALDTSTRQASVALCSEERLYGEHTWQAGNNHSVEMLEHVQRLLAEGGVSMSALDGLAVAIGPGSFNGVRVAVATAKTLAFALGKPLVGISTLEIAAAQHAQWPGLVCSLLEAGRSELYAGCFLFEPLISVGGFVSGGSRQLGEYRVLTPRELVSYLQMEIAPLLEAAGVAKTTPLLCGEISEASRLELAKGLRGGGMFVPAISSVRRASTLASLAWLRVEEQRLDDPLTLEPLYVRRPNITTSTRKQPLLGTQSTAAGPQNDQISTERDEGALRH
ncbi:MAG TPA: tRNA (adenosine(37)-N6)-threonylcarbamoyltransferase complex dimerization subunit type 1 TsaB [Ktedonobacteraceae bacterium]